MYCILATVFTLLFGLDPLNTMRPTSPSCTVSLGYRMVSKDESRPGEGARLSSLSTGAFREDFWYVCDGSRTIVLFGSARMRLSIAMGPAPLTRWSSFAFAPRTRSLDRRLKWLRGLCPAFHARPTMPAGPTTRLRRRIRATRDSVTKTLRAMPARACSESCSYLS